MKNSGLLYLIVIPLFFIVNWIIKHFSLFYDFSSQIFLILNIFIILLILKHDVRLFIIFVALTINFSYRIQFSYLSITYLGFIYIYFIILFLYYLFLKKGINIKEVRYLLLIIAYAIIISGDINIRSYLSYIFNLFGGFIVLIISYFVKDNNFRLSKSLLFIPLIFSPLIIYEIIYRPNWGGIYNAGVFRIFGTNVWPNTYALHIDIIIIFTLSMYFGTKKYLYLFLSLLYAIFLFHTYSRTGLLALVIGVVVIILLRGYCFKLNIANILSIVMIILMFFFFITKFPSSRLSNINRYALLGERVNIWNDIMPQMSGHYFTGRGLGGYEEIRGDVERGLSAHNAYLNILSNIGVIGLIFYLIILSYLLINIYKIMINSNEINVKIFSRGTIANIILMSIFGFVGEAPLMLQATFIFWIILGFIYRYKGYV